MLLILLPNRITSRGSQTQTMLKSHEAIVSFYNTSLCLKYLQHLTDEGAAFVSIFLRACSVHHYIPGAWPTACNEDLLDGAE